MFGFFEALTFTIGWLLGYLANDWIADWDPSGLVLPLAPHRRVHVVQATPGGTKATESFVIAADDESNCFRSSLFRDRYEH